MDQRPPARSVFLLLACLYLLSLGRGFYGSDGEVMFKTAAALAERGTFALQPDPGLPQIVRGRAGSFYSKYDPGLPLLAVPFYWAGDRIAHINQAHRYQLAATLVLAIPALAAAGAGVALYLLARRLYGGHRALGAALAAGLATPLWPYARMLYAEAVLACALAGAAALIYWTFTPSPNPSPLVREGPGMAGKTWLLAAGVVFGMGMLVRAAFAIYAVPLAVLVVGQAPARRRERVVRLGAFAAGAIPFGAILLGHNALRFGDPFRFGYAGEGFSTPPWEGIAGLLFSPGKGVFLYAPPLALSVALWPRFRRAYPALGVFLALAWGAALAFYGTWWAWHGGWTWGPRFLVPLIPLSCLPLGMLPDRRAWRALAGALVAAGIGVQALGVLTDVTAHYASVVGADEARVALVNFAPRYSPLVGAVQRIAHGQTEPLALFHLKDTGLPPTWTIGVPLLLVLGAALGIRAVMHATWRE